MNEFEQMVTRLVKDGELIKEELTPDQAHLWHMATGVAGEAGELIDAVKKHIIYRRKLDIKNMIEELGDLEFYIEGIRQIIGVSRDVVIDNNIAKLSVRYAELKYSDQQAQERKDKHE